MGWIFLLSLSVVFYENVLVVKIKFWVKAAGDSCDINAPRLIAADADAPWGERTG